MSNPIEKEIVTALRCKGEGEGCNGCFMQHDMNCRYEDIMNAAADLIESQAARIRELETQVGDLSTSRAMRECTAALIDAIGMLAHDTGNGNCNYFEDAHSDLASTVREVAHETD